MISARAKGVSTVPVPLVVPGVQDPHDPDLLDHLPGAHRYLAAPVQRGEPPAEPGGTRPVRSELARSGRRVRPVT